jgi:hypothetical protein
MINGSGDYAGDLKGDPAPIKAGCMLGPSAYHCSPFQLPALWHNLNMPTLASPRQRSRRLHCIAEMCIQHRTESCSNDHAAVGGCRAKRLAAWCKAGVMLSWHL